MARPIYTLLVLLLLPWAVIHLLWRSRRQPEYLKHWGERFARYRTRPSDVPTIWLHAVSVGETRAAQPLVSALRQRYPDHRILFTHMTPTGRATSESLYGDSVERIYLPYDTPWAMQRFLRHVRPRLGLIMETELWPNLLAACREQSVPLLLVNARLSERSAQRYAKFPVLTAEALQSLAAIGAQSDKDAKRLEALGAQNITITGNLKFDITIPAAQFEIGSELRQRHDRRLTWLAASTREGEEALILDAWRKAGAASGALLVIVPRHPQRFDEVARLARDRGWCVQLRSDNAVIAADTEIVIGDSMGEMFAYYASVDLAFIGGSLLDFGSQNLIEAAACGTPVLIGPSTRNFAEAARAALACGAARSVVDAEDLVSQVLGLLGNEAERTAIGQAGREFAARHRGATARTMELLSRAAR
jgi:3-deoxy-D-manno-octulosonic-acid transferase